MAHLTRVTVTYTTSLHQQKWRPVPSISTYGHKNPDNKYLRVFIFYNHLPTCLSIPTSIVHRLRSIVMRVSVCGSVCVSVCVSVCLSERISPEPHVRSLPVFVHVAYVRGSVLLRHVYDRPHRLSSGSGWREECTALAKCNLRSPCLSVCLLCAVLVQVMTDIRTTVPVTISSSWLLRHKPFLRRTSTMHFASLTAPSDPSSSISTPLTST